MKFEWDDKKNHTNKAKHDIDFNEAKALWNDINRIEIQTSYPLENRSILIGKVDRKLWIAIFTRRGKAIRIISVRRAGKQEAKLYAQKENS